MKIVCTKQYTQLKNINYQLGWAVASGQFIQTDNIWREDLDGRMSPLVGSKGDKLMFNHGLIASSNISKVNICSWLLPPSELTWPCTMPSDLYKMLHSCPQYASVTSVFCMYYVVVIYIVYCVYCVCNTVRCHAMH